jgi:hypothetical protein
MSVAADEEDEVEHVVSEVAKAVVATLVAVITVLQVALTDDHVDSVELVNVGIAFVTAVGVYWVPNMPHGAGRYGKAFVAVAGAALQALVPFLSEGRLTAGQWLIVMLAGLGALGVTVVPNARQRAALTGRHHPETTL